MSKLRTEYVKGLGIELTAFDYFDFSKKFIRRFAKRKSQLKVQPCGDDVPVICYPGQDYVSDRSSLAKDINWTNATLWTLNYYKLLKMQAIHDKEIINRSEK